MGPAAALEVKEIVETVAMLKSKGVRFAEETSESSVCFMALALDPDGNSIWIHQRKPDRAPYAGPEISFVCYPVKNKGAASEFYGGLLGLEKTTGHDFPDGFWYEYELGAGTLALCNFWKPSAEPSMGPAIAFEVEDFQAAVADLEAKNTPFPMAPVETPGCFMCVVTDPDGNSLFIHKRKPKA